MKKTLLFIVAVLFACLGANAAEAYKTLTFPDGNSEKISAYTETWTATMGDDVWTIANFNNNNNGWDYIKCGSKRFDSVASIASPSIDKAIGSVVVTIDKITDSSVNSIKLVVASDADFSNEVETVVASSLKAGDMTFNTTKAAANNYYKIVFDCAKGSTNGLVQVSKVQLFESSSTPGGSETVDISNTPETAYTVAKALELIAAGEGLSTSVYVKGIIIGTPDISTSYHNATYDIADSEDGDKLNIFRGYYLANSKFTSGDEIEDGDEVIVYGQLSTYNGASQMSSGNYIYSKNGKIGAGIAWSATTAEVALGAEGTYPTLTNPQNVTISYNSSNEAVATISNEGTITPIAAGTTVITASFAGDATYVAQTVSYTLTVTQTTVDISNTAETAYTVAKAHELITAGVGLDTWVYVKGTISYVKSYSSKYGSITYSISDDGTSNDSILVYGGLNLEKAKFTSKTDLTAGEKVVIYGKLVNYNGTHEINSNNYLISREKSVDISNTPETAYTVSKAYELIAAGNDLDTKVYVKGIVIGTPDISTSYGNATYNIADSSEGTTLLKIFRGYYLDGVKFTDDNKDQLVENAEVVVYGKLVDYNGTYEMNSGNYLVSINGKSTGIKDITSQTANDAPAYNLAGQKVGKSYKGVVIRNGKKFVQK